MATVSSTTKINPFYSRVPTGQSTNVPGDALNRLQLSGKAHEPWREVVQFDVSDLETVGRSLNAERKSIEDDYGRGTQADNALSQIDEMLAKADDLAAANEKRSTARADRQKNQKEIDAILKEITDKLHDAGTADERVLAGDTTLKAGAQSVKIDAVTFANLGRITAHGHAVGVKDLASHKPLDTARHKSSTATLARDSIAAARATIKDVRTTIETFQRDVMRPRLGDIATSIDGLYSARATTLTSTNAAMQTAIDLRSTLIASATLAAAVGADGWDKDRVLALVSP